jgi:hypothetical protein
LSGILANCPHCGKLTAVPRETPVQDAAEVEIPAAAYVPVSDHRPTKSMSQRNQQFARGGMFAGGGGLIAVVVILRVITGAIRAASSHSQLEREEYRLPSPVVTRADREGLQTFSDLAGLRKFRAKVALVTKYEITSEQADAFLEEHEAQVKGSAGASWDDDAFIASLLKAADERFPELKPLEAEPVPPAGADE